jgi:hypothetical protein
MVGCAVRAKKTAKFDLQLGHERANATRLDRVRRMEVSFISDCAKETERCEGI